VARAVLVRVSPEARVSRPRMALKPNKALENNLESCTPEQGRVGTGLA
jgi:hypothetical protein